MRSFLKFIFILIKKKLKFMGLAGLCLLCLMGKPILVAGREDKKTNDFTTF